MREIEFRGKISRNTFGEKGEWIFGCLVDTDMIFSRYNEPNELACEQAPVDPETVGQYTGLKDKNGVKIFEGDIVQYGIHEKKKYLVVYLEVDAGFFLSEDTRCIPAEIRGNPLGRTNTYYLKVVGNIHDNPELLEAANE